jgi:hypothetical protein
VAQGTPGGVRLPIQRAPEQGETRASGDGMEPDPDRSVDELRRDASESAGHVHHLEDAEPHAQQRHDQGGCLRLVPLTVPNPLATVAHGRNEPMMTAPAPARDRIGPVLFGAARPGEGWFIGCQDPCSR